MKYLVVAETSCTECSGEGIVPHPLWTLYWKETGGNESDVEWFRDEGYPVQSPRDLPPEEIECATCQGAGIIRNEMPLSEAVLGLGPSFWGSLLDTIKK